ncbi:hypothetical protein [Pseudomonas syringae]|uniref:hypothetical protein n=1 Tax=Pseudomonas syringae TaxID=317 RepID=UPI000A5E7860|nr:hypothetical protein [Pseudomonas syringae]
MSNSGITVGDLKRQLEFANNDDLLEFDGGLTFSRIKRRGDNLLVLEFGEPQAYLDDEFRQKNPHVKVAFIRFEPLSEGQIIQEVDISLR